MTRHLSVPQLTLVVVGLVLTAGVLLLLLYAVHKLFERERQQRKGRLAAPRPADETAFALATMQGVITGLRAREKELKELLQDAERRASTSARFLENVVREVPLGILLVNREGFLALSNPAVRVLLAVDTWSRRRYPEVLGPESPLTACIRECLEAGRKYEREPVEYVTPTGETCLLQVSVSPVCSQDGQVGGALCLLTRVEAKRPTSSRDPG